MLLFGRKKQHQQSGQLKDLEGKLAVESERAESRSAQINELKEKVEQQESSYQQQQIVTETDKVRIAELNTLLEDERKLTQEKISLLQKADKSMTLAFENLSNKILEEKSKKFTEQNKLNMGEILNPLREQLGDFKKKIEDVYDKETRDRVSLFNEITSLKSLNQQMSKDAINLTKALKGESKTRGNWGEVILQRVLEDSGLENGREYETQKSYRDQHGKRFQPDVVIHLPDNKHVVIDSKVSLNAYEKFCSSEISEEKEQALAEHLNSIRKHITDLQGKNYDELANVNSLDMVLMFVPIEPAL
ncbi:MAG: DNA recombination protein RmuC, partial [Calditrichia bacterium]